MRVLNDPESILNDLDTDTFDIVSSLGARPVCNGAMTKYSPEIAARDGAFTTLEAGQSVTIVHNLSTTYNFSEAGTGDFTFTPRNTFFVVKDDGSIDTIEANTEVLSARIHGLLALEKRSVYKHAAFPGCTEDRANTITTAYDAASSIATNSYLASRAAAVTRYTTWFGSFDTARRSIVISHFQKISASDWDNFTYDCSCNMAGTYAYVYPTRPGFIWLCPVFWSTTATGTDSRAGTLVHEVSHWNVNGGTRDSVYGQSGAKNLASSNPARAVMNADNHEYFAENTPAEA